MDELSELLESGKLEAYCLGLSNDEEAKQISILSKENPLVKQTITNFLNALQQTAEQLNPHDRVDNKKLLLDRIKHIEENKKLIHRDSELSDWIHFLDQKKNIIIEEGIGVLPIFTSSKVDQVLMSLDNELTETEHEEVQESFLILEGSCVCNFGGKIINLKAGDYVDVPRRTKHSIKNTSPHGPVVALVQRVYTQAA